MSALGSVKAVRTPLVKWCAAVNQLQGSTLRLVLVQRWIMVCGSAAKACAVLVILVAEAQVLFANLLLASKSQASARPLCTL